jgi:putative adhesin
MNRHLAALALIQLVLPAAALRAQESTDEWLADCRDGSGDWAYRFRHCEVRETGMKPNGRPLSVEPGMNGGVEIIGWDKDSIAVTARIQVSARTKEDAEAMAHAIKIEASGATVRVAVPGGAVGRHQNWGVNLVVMVPRRTDLTISTENGPLSVEDVAGRMELQTQNGPLSLSGVGGDVHASAQNGPLTVELLGTRWDGAGLQAETQNGPAELQIPDNYNAKIEFGTVNGPMDVGFPMTVTISGRVKDRISTTLGTGGPPIRVVTTNGPMVVRKTGS